MTAEIIFDTPAVRQGLAVSVAAVAPALAAEQLAQTARSITRPQERSRALPAVATCNP